MSHPQELKAVLSEVRGLLHRVYGDRLVKVVLFGSQARGDAREDSDIDILVVLRQRSTLDERERVYAALSDLCLERLIVVSLTFVTEHAYIAAATPMLANVAREGIAL